MRSIDPRFRTVNPSSVAFDEFPGAKESGYA